MKTLLAAALFTVAATLTATAQPARTTPATQDTPLPQAEPSTAAPEAAPADDCCATTPPAAPQPTVAYAEPAPGGQPPLEMQHPPGMEVDDEGGWKRPPGRRFIHGFRLGWTYVFNMEKATRENGMSLAEEFELKSPNMMLLGYEGFYRIVGHSWLNVLIVGNVTVAGLEQSKFIPAASGLIGMEFNKAFQLGVGVNVTPDPEAPTHMIAAAGWTPKVGMINTPVHFFFVPDTEGNHRMGATVGMTW